MHCQYDSYYTLFLKEYPAFAAPQYFINFSNLEPRIIIKIFLNNKSVTSPKIEIYSLKGIYSNVY